MYKRQDNIRIIASDFDGTILKDGAQHVDEEYFPLIRELKSMGTVSYTHLQLPVEWKKKEE